MIKFKLKEFLIENNITPKELAEKPGMNRNTVKAILSGETSRVELKVLNNLCYNLKCQPGDLLEYTPD